MTMKRKIAAVAGSLVVFGTATAVGVSLFIHQDPETEAGSVSSDSTKQPTTQASPTKQPSSSSKSPSSTETSLPTETPTQAPTETPTPDAGTSQEQTYSASVLYSVPRSSNSITVTVGVTDGVISSVSTENSYTDHESGRYISRFESDLQTDAVGQSLSTYSPSRIGGASLTTQGFSDALSQIRTEAGV